MKYTLNTVTELSTLNTEIYRIVIKAINAEVAAPFRDIE